MFDARVTDELLENFFEWWTKPGNVRRPTFLSDDFTFDLGYGGMANDDLVWWVQQKPPWRDLRVVARIVHEDKAALVFEGTDSATSLRHRVAWFVEVSGDKILRVVETDSRLGP
jgi:hypothetical protein